MKILLKENIKSKCVFSKDKKHRYYLERLFNNNNKPKMLVFIMLNPSVADLEANDPTVERCQRRATFLNYDGFIVLNVFSYRSTCPKRLFSSPDHTREKNLSYIEKITKKHNNVICAWGNHASFKEGSLNVRNVLRKNNVKAMALDVNKSGEPKHPLYVSYKKIGVVFEY